MMQMQMLQPRKPGQVSLMTFHRNSLAYIFVDGLPLPMKQTDTFLYAVGESVHVERYTSDQ